MKIYKSICVGNHEMRMVDLNISNVFYIKYTGMVDHTNSIFLGFYIYPTLLDDARVFLTHGRKPSNYITGVDII
jgi:hypothetical protein